MDRLLGTVGLAMRAGKVKTGAYTTLRCISGGKAALIVAAADIGSDNRHKIETACKSADVPIIYHGSAAALGRSIGKENVPVLCICDDSFAAAVKKYEREEGLPNE